MKWNNKGHQYDELGNNFANKKIVIYGAAALGQELYEDIKFLGTVEAFVDRNKSIQETGCKGLPVISVGELAKKKEDVIVVISVPGYNGMMVHSQLMHLGFELGKNCFYYDTFVNYYLSIYALYACGLTYFPSISFLLTTTCNLNCKGCLNFTKQNKNRRHYGLDELKENADAFFKHVDYVGKFHMSGGEPFHYPHYEELLEYIGSKYGKQIKDFYTATNGTVIPRASLVNSLKKYDVFVEVDDYRQTLSSDVLKNDDVLDMLCRHGIRHSDRGAGYWINLDPENQNNSSLSEQDLGIWYDTCNNPFASVHNGRLYSCNYDDYAKEAGIVADSDLDYLDLKENDIDKKVLLEFRQGFTTRGYTNFCKRCAGHEMTNQKHIPVAEQY